MIIFCLVYFFMNLDIGGRNENENENGNENWEIETNVPLEYVLREKDFDKLTKKLKKIEKFSKEFGKGIASRIANLLGGQYCNLDDPDEELGDRKLMAILSILEILGLLITSYIAIQAINSEADIATKRFEIATSTLLTIVFILAISIMQYRNIKNYLSGMNFNKKAIIKNLKKVIYICKKIKNSEVNNEKETEKIINEIMKNGKTEVSITKEELEKAGFTLEDFQILEPFIELKKEGKNQNPIKNNQNNLMEFIEEKKEGEKRNNSEENGTEEIEEQKGKIIYHNTIYTGEKSNTKQIIIITTLPILDGKKQ